MREIKFRGRERESNKWVFGYVRHWKCCYGDEWHIQGKNDNVHIVIPETVGQFTGLYDCDGHEIYEGDVVRHENCICLVVYNSTRFASFALRKDGWAFDHYFGEAFDASECQVIGNVHDNPELLEATHD